MTAAETDEPLARLREPFPPEHVGLLPRITCPNCSKAQGRCCNEHSKSKCNACGNWITERHIHLDYVGHGAVTDRLLSVDPHWSWEPLAFDEGSGMPTFTYDDQMRPVSLWIKLTVCGVTRLGVGTCDPGQTDAEKVLIGDALRNAAMRFGVALDLWIKGQAEDSEQQSRLRTTAPAESSDRPEPVSRFVAPSGEVIDLWPGELSAKDAKDQVIKAAGDDRGIAASAWSAAGLNDRLKVTAVELEAALATVASPKPAEPAPDSTDDRPIDAYTFGLRAHSVFEEAVDPEKIPRGKKTWLLKALRHALIYACTDGEASGGKDADGSQLFLAWGLLDDLEAGRVTFEFNASPGKGVTFTWVDQSTTSVMWTDLTLAEADAEVERRAGAA